MHRGERGAELGTPIFRGGYRGAIGAMFFFFLPYVWYRGGYKGVIGLDLRRFPLQRMGYHSSIF
jgi:hypothetical protein